jgi:Tfp pilus assembly protein FimT
MAALEVMMTFAIGQRRNKPAFTLIELILVMTIMIMIIGAVFPSMKGFFHGRNLDNEARQFLSLTRYGRSRAIAEGIPVELWIDPSQEKYGLQALSGYSETQTNPMVFAVDQTVRITFSAPPTLLTHSNMWTQTTARSGAVTKIRFQPDGFISDTSPENIFFQQQDTGDEIWIAEAPAHLRYDIQTGHFPGARH